MLICDNLAYSSWGKSLFKGLGVCLTDGSLLVVLGDTKAKTALLDIMAGRRLPKSGQVRFEAEPVYGNKEYAKLMLHIGVDNALNPHLSVEENIQQFASAEIDGLTHAAMRYFKLTAYAATPCRQLPLHMQRRVALTRLLALPCPIWLIDHRVESLDEEGAGLLYALISNRCNQQGIVVIAAESADFITPCQPLHLNDFR
jgi:heme exporter protein A